MPQLSMYCPEYPFTGDRSDKTALVAWAKETEKIEDEAYSDLVAMLALADLQIASHECCEDPACPVVLTLEATMRRVWRMIPPTIMLRAFGPAGASTLTAR